MFAIDEYVLKTLIYEPAEFDSYDIPNQRKNDLLRLHDHFQPESSQSVLNDNKWECDKNLLGICLANIPTYSSFNVRIALTIFGQGMRIFFLQNERNHSFWSYFNMMAKQLFNSNSRDRFSNEMARFYNEEYKMGDGISNSITSILQRSSKPLGFASDYVQRSALNLMILLKAWPADKLNETFSYDKKAGLYVFDVTTNGTNRAVVPILLYKEGKHFQCVAAVYSSKGGDKVWMRLVTRSLEGVCDYGYYMCQCYNVQGKLATFKCTTPSRINCNINFRFSMRFKRLL
jgi:hypothetical protein